MAVQIEKVFSKKESDADFIEVDKVYNGEELLFQKSPIKDAYYDYTKVVLNITAVANPYYTVVNTSAYTLNVMFTNGEPYSFAPGKGATFALSIMPKTVSINDCPAVELSTVPSTNWYHNKVPYKYHPAEYKRELWGE